MGMRPTMSARKESVMQVFQRFMLSVVVALFTLVPFGSVHAQQGSQYFPETGHTVAGRFLQYWQQNGGLAVFGFPLTEERQENGRAVQYFERQRFELHPENQRPYDVLLGRLGDELLLRRGVNWQTDVPPANPAPGCTYFSQTRHNVCDQGSGVGFPPTG
jgi:thermitase